MDECPVEGCRKAVEYDPDTAGAVPKSTPIERHRGVRLEVR
jgi:hypothetical protein